MTSNFYFLNGKIVKESDAKISINDLGLLRGYGVFDVLRTYFGKPFLLEEHLLRLFNSAQNIGLKIPYSKAEIKKITNKLLKKVSPESTIKIIVTGGTSADGFFGNGKPTFAIVVKSLEKAINQKGAKLITTQYEREIASAKLLNYVRLVQSQNLLRKEKAFTLLYLKGDEVLEGAVCNIFLIRGNKLITPKARILEGLTRNYVIKIAKKHYKVEERKVTLKELFNAEEIFVTSTIKGILPVIQIDNKKIGHPNSINKTRALIDLFNASIHKLS